jgi:hypothetical protein
MVKVVEKRVTFPSLEDMVMLQLILHCFAKDIHLSKGDINLLTHIAIYGYDCKNTPQQLVDKRVFLHKQSVRNTRNKLVQRGLLIEDKKAHYMINPDMNIESHGVIMVDFKAINRAE